MNNEENKGVTEEGISAHSRIRERERERERDVLSISGEAVETCEVAVINLARCSFDKV